MSAPVWWDGALCRCSSRGASFFAEDTRHAKAICALCPVWEQCLDHGLHEPVGVWGGLTTDERARLCRLRSRLTAAPGDPRIAVDVRSLVLRAGMAPERVGAATGAEPGTVTAWIKAGRRPRRRSPGDRVDPARSAT